MSGCPHPTIDAGRCIDCGACVHELILNRVCMTCGEIDPVVTVKAAGDAVIQVDRLRRRRES